MRALRRRWSAVRVTVVCGVFSYLAAGCGSEEVPRALPITPSVLPPAASVTALKVTEVDRVLSIGETVQLHAVATFSDGVARDVTSEVTWGVSNTSVTISSGGLLTVRSSGEVEISAALSGVRGTGRIVAVTAGYTITGLVREAFATSVLVEAARVEVVGGPHDGLVLMTDGAGRFELSRVTAAGFALKVKKPGYEDAHYNVVALPRDARPDIAIRPVPVGPPPVARLSLFIDAAGSTGGLVGFTPIRFDGSASSAESATYSLDFGDGHGTTSAIAVHACERRDLLTARLTVTDRFGRTSATTALYACLGLVHMQGPVYSVTYGWVHGTNAASGPPLRRLGFERQDGSVFSGIYSGPEGRKHFTGTMSGENRISISLDDGTMSFAGHVVLKDSWTSSSYFVDRRLILTARGGTADGTTLEFRFNDPF